MLKEMGYAIRIVLYNKRFFAAFNTSVKILAKVILLNQMKPSQPKILGDLFVTQEKYKSLLLGLEFLTYKLCVLNLDEKILLCGRDQVNIPLNTQNVDKVR